MCHVRMNHVSRVNLEQFEMLTANLLMVFLLFSAGFVVSAKERHDAKQQEYDAEARDFAQRKCYDVSPSQAEL